MGRDNAPAACAGPLMIHRLGLQAVNEEARPSAGLLRLRGGSDSGKSRHNRTPPGRGWRSRAPAGAAGFRRASRVSSSAWSFAGVGSAARAGSRVPKRPSTAPATARRYAAASPARSRRSRGARGRSSHAGPGRRQASSPRAACRALLPAASTPCTSPARPSKTGNRLRRELAEPGSFTTTFKQAIARTRPAAVTPPASAPPPGTEPPGSRPRSGRSLRADSGCSYAP